MKTVKISVKGNVKGQVTTYPDHVYTIEANGKTPATKQIGAALFALLPLLSGLTDAKFILESEGRKIEVAATTNGKIATQKILLALPQFSSEAGTVTVNRSEKQVNPLLADIATSFGLKGTDKKPLAKISVMEYNTAISHRFGILTKAERVQKVETLKTVTTDEDKQVLAAFRVLFPTKKQLADAAKQTDATPAK